MEARSLAPFIISDQQSLNSFIACTTGDDKPVSIQLANQNLGDHLISKWLINLAELNKLTLSEINLERNNLTTRSIIALTTLLCKHHSHLITLNLNNNKISSNGIKQLAACFNKINFPQKCTFNFSGCDIGNSGLSAIAALIKKGHIPAHTTFDFSNNRIDTNGLSTLADSLGSKNAPISLTLNLSTNKLCGTGIKKLISALKKVSKKI